MKPSLPAPSSTLSIWHRTTRSFPHLHANRLTTVPTSAKYVIIGSGISGALTAWKLIESGVKGEDILILESREAVSGASGRNAGHIRPNAFGSFPGYAATHGPEQAVKVLENEKSVLENIRKFVEEHDVDCDFRYTNTFDVATSEEQKKSLADAFVSFKAAGGDTSHITVYEGDEAKIKTRAYNALVAYESPAASNHPGKLVQWILNDFISKGGKLWTHCAATKVVSSGSSSSWDVYTVRGTVTAATVVHCTNAYAAYLLPDLSQFITPRRSQVHAFIPRLSLSGEYAMKHTMALRYGNENFFSVNPLNNGTILLGGSGTRTSSDGHSAQELISFDDSLFSERIAKSSTREFTGLCEESAQTPLRHGEGLDHAWTGIIGTTKDKLPLVGPVEGRKDRACSSIFGVELIRFDF
ncbi:hypothetical protein N7495_008642 [Penicillium taxi]|uniref:uncharacterized protein n=1 Tax=Penicillium taxi TaxID=168475 RepID=UPI002545071F|nr:uncharacterized protein N7495_008642 [Penicillium taxi]KAJ5888601.1 hypothetical protein N7495_008642 [Penicillium taxi]